MSDMKTTSLSIRLDEDLERMLVKVSRDAGLTRSEVARDALRRQSRIRQFENLRRRVMSFAGARGFPTDEDVFTNVMESGLATRGLALDNNVLTLQRYDAAAEAIRGFA